MLPLLIRGAKMFRDTSRLIIINGVEMPCPDYGMQIVSVQTVDAARNTNASVVGQLVGRRMWKIDGLQWTGLSQEQWSKIKKAIKPFYVNVQFTDDEGGRQSVTMYPGDVTAKPLFVENGVIKQYEVCSFNLVDCGW